MKIRSVRLMLWEIGCVVWVAVAGSMLHFAFELSGYQKPMALLAAVNESAWEHTKMYFWPGLVWALVQYTYTRRVASNYWLGKALALGSTPLVIFALYFGYMSWIVSTGGKATLATMLSIMVAGIAFGQWVSYRVLTSPPVAAAAPRYATAAFAVLVLMFSSFTYFPPRMFLFENFSCYTYTGEYGILRDYTNYRVFVTRDAQGGTKAGGGMNYCAHRGAQSMASAR
jgi:hypothetical protein